MSAPSRTRLRFGIRTLLVLIAIAAVGSLWGGRHLRKQWRIGYLKHQWDLLEKFAATEIRVAFTTEVKEDSNLAEVKKIDSATLPQSPDDASFDRLLTHITLYGPSFHLEDETLVDITSLSSLKSVEIDLTNFDHDVTQAGIQTLQLLSNLESVLIHIPGFQLDQESIDAISQCQNLREVEIDVPTHLVQYAEGRLKRLPKIEQITVRSQPTNWSDPDTYLSQQWQCITKMYEVYPEIGYGYDTDVRWGLLQYVSANLLVTAGGGTQNIEIPESPVDPGFHRVVTNLQIFVKTPSPDDSFYKALGSLTSLRYIYCSIGTRQKTTPKELQHLQNLSDLEFLNFESAPVLFDKPAIDALARCRKLRNVCIHVEPDLVEYAQKVLHALPNIESVMVKRPPHP